eukprot:scaffold4511_cov171-Amphora_coffeaeformis.AAC.14
MVMKKDDTRAPKRNGRITFSPVFEGENTPSFHHGEKLAIITEGRSEAGKFFFLVNHARNNHP